MKKYAILTLILLSLLAAACAMSSQAAQANPTQAVAATATATAVAPSSGPTAESAKSSAQTDKVAVPRALSAKEPIPCPMPLPPNEIEGKTIVCGQITVPENWKDPGNSPAITINYARLLSPSKAPFPEPILFLIGGPGGSSLSSLGSEHFDFAYIRRTRDVILYDQRGTRYSSDLRCPFKVAVPDAEASSAAKATLPKIDLDMDLDEQIEIAAQMAEIEGYGRCADYFRDQGIDLTQISTASSVRDAIALMDQLDYPAYNLLGISYGTMLGLSILDYYDKASAPDALPPLRSAIIDGVMPPNAGPGVVAQVFNEQLVVLRIFAACEANPDCSAAYPNIRQRAIDLLYALEKKPLVREDGTKVTFQNVAVAMKAAVGNKNAEALALLPRMVAELEAGKTTSYDVAKAYVAGALTAPKPASKEIDPIALKVASLAEELRAIAASLDGLGEVSEDVAEARARSGSLPDVFIDVLDRYFARAGAEERNNFETWSLAGLAQIPELQTREGLIGTIGALTSRTVADELILLVKAMSDAEVAVVLAKLTDPNYVFPLSYVSHWTLSVVQCNDRVAHTDLEGLREQVKNSESNLMKIAAQLVETQYYIGRCQAMGLGKPQGEPIPDGAVSDVPTLVMNGTLDTQTPVEQGELAYKTLTNAEILTFPSSGHGATRYSDCARDIAAGFYTYPDAKINAACIAELEPAWVMPADALPKLPLPDPVAGS